MSRPAEVLPGVYDWSTVHNPASTDLFFYPKPDEWKNYLLTDETVNRFWRDGYISNIPILTAEQCDLILQDYKYFTGRSQHPSHSLLYEYHSNQSGDLDNVLLHCLGHWRLTRLFHDLIFHPKVTVPCSQLVAEGCRKPVRFWHDQLFAKPAYCGGNVAWHQDYSYWTRTKPCMHVTVHIALDEQTEENGGLMYIPTSHRWNRNGQPLPVLDFNFKDMEGIKTILTDDELEAFKPKPALLKKGEASFHAAMTVHGSYGNRSAAARRAAVLNYFADGVLSDSDEGLLVKAGHAIGPDHLYKAANIPKGQKMEGQFYPLVFDPAWQD